MKPPDKETWAAAQAACIAKGLDKAVCVSCVFDDSIKSAVEFKRPPRFLLASDPQVPDLVLCVNPSLWPKRSDERIEAVLRLIETELHIERGV